MIKIDQALTKKDLCAELQVSMTAIDNAIKNGCPHYKVGKSVRFIREETFEWFKKGGNSTNERD